MLLRSLTTADLPDLLIIENSVSVVPWSIEAFKGCFNAGCLGWGSFLENKMIGFIMIAQSLDECHILNIAVAREYQGQGCGRQLLELVLKQAKQKGIGIVYLEVRLSNTRAIHLYKKMHFLLIGQRKNYYPTVSGREDALVFAFNIQKKLG